MSKVDMNELRERAEKFVQADAAMYKYWHDKEGLHPVCQCIRDLLAALDEQGEVIGKLPVTSDGVTIYPGMVVWFADNDDPVEVDVGQDTVYDDDTYQHLASMVYSTPEAALAAREQAQGDNDD